MKKTFFLFLFLLFLLPLNIFAQTDTTDVSEFEETVKKHLKSIDERNYSDYVSTVTEKDDLNLIMPNGVHFSSRKQILDFMKIWFAEKTWEMKYTIINMKETSEMGFVLLMVNYTDVDQNNTPYSLLYYLNLIFEKEETGWKLVHDQNTMCYDQNKK